MRNPDILYKISDVLNIQKASDVCGRNCFIGFQKRVYFNIIYLVIFATLSTLGKKIFKLKLWNYERKTCWLWSPRIINFNLLRLVMESWFLEINGVWCLSSLIYEDFDFLVEKWLWVIYVVGEIILFFHFPFEFSFLKLSSFIFGKLFLDLYIYFRIIFLIIKNFKLTKLDYFQ